MPSITRRSLLAAGALLAIPACTAPLEEKPQLSVFAAASLTEALEEASPQFEEAEVLLTLDSSGKLRDQIKEGAQADVFISAAQKQMGQLAEASLIDEAGRFDILENKVVLVVPEGNPAGIESFDDLATHLEAGDILFAMGNEEVPVGTYTLRILEHYGLSEDDLVARHLITYGDNVKAVTAQVSEGTVDAGVIYASDAFSAGLPAIAVATEEMCGRVVYPAAVLAGSAQPELAASYLRFLCGDAGRAAFERVGFTPLA